ncbi:MAG: SDR family oxidoreductase [Galbitalea sp.]
MSIVVTGASGHLGRLIVDGLLREGVAPSDIIAGARNIDTIADLAAKGVVVRHLDYEDPASLKTAFAGADTLMLVSGSEVGKRAVQHRAAIDAAVAAGITRIVYTSAPKATTTTLIVAPEHKITEELLAASGLATTILRNGWYTENYLDAANQARESGVIVASVGDGRVASASRVDYADAAVAVLTAEGHDGKIYELSGDVAWNFDDLASAVGAVIGREVVYKSVTPEEQTAILKSAGLDDGTIGFIVAMDADIKAGCSRRPPATCRGSSAGRRSRSPRGSPRPCSSPGARG